MRKIKPAQLAFGRTLIHIYLLTYLLPLISVAALPCTVNALNGNTYRPTGAQLYTYYCLYLCELVSVFVLTLSISSFCIMKILINFGDDNCSSR